MKIKIFIISFFILIWVDTSFAKDYSVSYCSSLEKVFIDGDHGSAMGSTMWPVTIQAAQNEYEGFQIIVKALTKNLTDVKVTANKFQDAKGHILPATCFSIHPVGYVHIVNPSGKLSGSYVGWWPDPILGFLQSVDVAQGKFQPFFVSIHIPKDQVAGVYSGLLTVKTAQSAPESIRVSIQVWNFRIPDQPSLPTVLGLYTSSISKIYGNLYDEELKEKYYNFLLNYKISPDNLYSGADYLDILARLKTSRWIGMLSLAHAPFLWEKDFDQKFNDFLEKAQQRYVAFQEKKLIKNAYFYIFDEVESSHKQKMKESFQRIKQKFPNIPIMTTSVPLDDMGDYPNVDYVVAMYDARFGIYQNTVIANARREGKKVFWYVSNYPGELNFAIENPLLNIRILMGADAAKYRPDGFLYWAISRWTIAPSTNTNPIQSGPLTQWDPQSLENYNGCGSWFYPGPDGPISSLRLEAYRDGVEDYEYYMILQKLIEEKQNAAPANVIENARAILAVSPNILQDTNPVNFVRSPQIFYNERQRLAEAILSLEDLTQSGGQDSHPPAPPTGVHINQN